jgi:hypothetical protein
MLVNRFDSESLQPYKLRRAWMLPSTCCNPLEMLDLPASSVGRVLPQVPVEFSREYPDEEYDAVAFEVDDAWQSGVLRGRSYTVGFEQASLHLETSDAHKVVRSSSCLVKTVYQTKRMGRGDDAQLAEAVQSIVTNMRELIRCGAIDAATYDTVAAALEDGPNMLNAVYDHWWALEQIHKDIPTWALSMMDQCRFMKKNGEWVPNVFHSACFTYDDWKEYGRTETYGAVEYAEFTVPACGVVMVPTD